MLADGEDTTGRYRQRRRTRTAIVNATADLLRRGGPPPGITEIAEAADVSRRTVYQYFPTVDQLLLDASLGLLTQSEVDSAIEKAGAVAGSAAERVDVMIDALGGLSAQTLPLGRSIIRLTVDAPDRQQQPKRGYRRIGWIEAATEPVRDQLDEANYQRLVSALALVIGWEALIVLHDLRDLDTSEQVAVSQWAARALIDAALAEPPRDEATGRR